MVLEWIWLMIGGFFVLLLAVIAWGAATGREAQEGLDSRGPTRLARRRRGGREMAESSRVCALCGVDVASQGDAGCPLIEALGFVMGESERATGELREP